MKFKSAVFILLALMLSSVSAEANLTQTEVSQLYVAIFGRASEGEGSRYWQTTGLDMATMANIMLETDAAKNYFGISLNSNDIITDYYDSQNILFQDNFDGTQIDSTKWNVNQIWNGNDKDQTQYFLNPIVSNGYLVFRDNGDLPLLKNNNMAFLGLRSATKYLKGDFEFVTYVPNFQVQTVSPSVEGWWGSFFIRLETGTDWNNSKIIHIRASKGNEHNGNYDGYGLFYYNNGIRENIGCSYDDGTNCWVDSAQIIGDKTKIRVNRIGKNVEINIGDTLLHSFSDVTSEDLYLTFNLGVWNETSGTFKSYYAQIPEVMAVEVVDNDCAVISSTAGGFASSGGSDTVTVTASSSNCTWTTSESLSWVSLSPAGGTGTGSVNIIVDANFGQARSGSVIIAGQTYIVSQVAPCTYSISPTSGSFTSSGGTSSVSVTASSSSCAWTASESLSWVSLSPTSGTGSGSVTITATSNTGDARSGSVTIAGKTYTISQTDGPIEPGTTKAKVYLGNADSFTVSNSGATVYGGSGNDTVTISADMSGVTLDQNIERINFSSASTTYAYKQTGNKINVYNSSSILLASVPVQGDNDGTVLSFSDGKASAILSAGVMTLGGKTVSPTTATSLLPAVTPASQSPSDNTSAKIYLGTDDSFTISNSGATVYGGSGNDTVTVSAGVTGVTLDQNVELIDLSGASSSYTFMQTGNKINVYDVTGVTLLLSVPVQGDTDGTVLSFNDVSASAMLSSGVMSLGGVTVSSTTPTTITLIAGSTISLSSQAFTNGGIIPLEYACLNTGGSNISPQLSWTSLPTGTVSYSLIMDDEDSPCGTGNNACRHWSVFNIPSSVTSLQKNQNIASISGATQGETWEGNIGYAGPCPPNQHTYTFTVYALGSGMPMIASGTQMTRSLFNSTYATHILGTATITGVFTP